MSPNNTMMFQSSSQSKQANSNSQSARFTIGWLHPKFWSTWLGLGLLGLIAWCPWRIQKSIARFLGYLLYHFASRRKDITQTNIEHCFKNLSPSLKKQLAQQVFYENTLGLIETAMTFFRSYSRLRANVTVTGQAALDEAFQQGKGIILIGAHYSTLDLGGVLFGGLYSVDILYRPHNNPIFNAFLLRARQRWAEQVIPHQSMKQIVRALRKGHIFWFPADQDYGLKHSVFAPFFGLEAATITTPNRLHKLTGSPVFILGHHRLDHQFAYQLTINPIPGFPYEDDVAAATAVNRALETEIKRYPAQYMWVHRRFKNQPNGKSLY